MSLAQPSRSATLRGLGAAILWAALASLTALAGAQAKIPPFQLAAMTFAVGTLVGLVWACMTGQSLRGLRSVPAGAWALGVYGLLAFHVCYFFAIQNTPPVEASLVIYLWPLLIVVFSAWLPAHLGGKRLAWFQITGSLLGFAGTALILTGRPATSAAGSLLGYGFAFAAALIRSSYSVGSRLFANVPSIAVIGSCAATAIGALMLHLALETWVTPGSTSAWLAILGLGLGPVGLAFYLWDDGMKHGDMRFLGVASYATPLLSTVLLAALGLGTLTANLWLAAVLITCGALLAAKDTLSADVSRLQKTPR